MQDPATMISALRDALEASPDNVILRKHFAEVLLLNGRSSEAADQFKSILELLPNDSASRLGLAKSLWAEGRYGDCKKVVDTFLDLPNCPAQAMMLHARLRTQSQDFTEALNAYHKAIEIDAEIADPELLKLLVGKLKATAMQSDAGALSYNNAITEVSDILFGYLEKPKITFADVGGLEPVKEAVRRKIVYPFQNPEIYRAYGKQAGGGVLLYGPPGVGKTFLARATAGEISASFISVGITDVLDMWMGNSEKHLHNFFTYARKHAPCVLFFDEIDAIAVSRAKSKGTAQATLVNQFLNELDGAKHSNEGVLILGATNALWHIDDAFRRPGRFDDVLFVPPPDHSARIAILESLCRGKPVDNIDFERIAKDTPMFSGADLQGLVSRAIDSILNDAIREKIPRPIRTADLLDALKLSKATTNDWFSTARNFVRYGNGSGTYDDLKPFL